MKILGANIGYYTKEGYFLSSSELPPHPRPFIGHDASAVLLVNGRVQFATEQERIDRCKHSSSFPMGAIRLCLMEKKLSLSEIDYLSIGCSDTTINSILSRFAQSELRGLSARDFINHQLEEEFGSSFDKNKIIFVPHHIAHGASAIFQSGFKDCLAWSIDGAGDGLCERVVSFFAQQEKVLDTVPAGPKSLGDLYTKISEKLGFGFGDEYKVMGLAAYGNADRHRSRFKLFYRLLEGSGFEIDTAKLIQYVSAYVIQTDSLNAIPQANKDIAAALQELLEDIVLHKVRHFKMVTGHKNLCLAGGVALNCVLVGKILKSNLFEDIFVQPAAHDAGLALGAALYQNQKVQKKKSHLPRITDVYWGNDIGKPKQIKSILKKWDQFITVEESTNIAKKAAKLLHEGNIIGWMQGRSEFGPRALGNRSILADPRKSSSKSFVNKAIKLREAYRPFAPILREEDLHTYFHAPRQVESLPFMNTVLPVKSEWQLKLKAVTHVDGNARVQTVSRKSNPMMYELISEFGNLSKVSALLNTSFNNKYEPIVDSVEDGLVCFLNSRLDALCIGNFLVTKRRSSPDSAILNLCPSWPSYVNIIVDQTQKNRKMRYHVVSKRRTEHRLVISEKTFSILIKLETGKNLYRYCEKLNKKERLEIINDVLKLWERRLIILAP